MGAVWLGHDTLLDRPVALKFLSNPEEGTQGRTRLLSEARALARVHHPNVAAVYRIGEAEGRSYIAYEYIDGVSLAQTATPLGWRSVLEIGLGLARGLAAVHRQGVLHCDIKPANVVLNRGGEPKLIDFGIARVRRLLEVPTRSDGAAELALEATGDAQFAGTPLYMAPELWQGRPFSEQTDLYALGLVLHELLAGPLAYRGMAGDELIAHLASREVPHLGDIVTGVPAALADLHRAPHGARPGAPVSPRRGARRRPRGDPLAVPHLHRATGPRRRRPRPPARAHASAGRPARRARTSLLRAPVRPPPGRAPAVSGGHGRSAAQAGERARAGRASPRGPGDAGAAARGPRAPTRRVRGVAGALRGGRASVVGDAGGGQRGRVERRAAAGMGPRLRPHRPRDGARARGRDGQQRGDPGLRAADAVGPAGGSAADAVCGQWRVDDRVSGDRRRAARLAGGARPRVEPRAGVGAPGPGDLPAPPGLVRPRDRARPPRHGAQRPLARGALARRAGRRPRRGAGRGRGRPRGDPRARHRGRAGGGLRGAATRPHAGARAPRGAGAAARGGDAGDAARRAAARLGRAAVPREPGAVGRGGPDAARVVGALPQGEREPGDARGAARRERGARPVRAAAGDPHAGAGAASQRRSGRADRRGAGDRGDAERGRR
jgi:hypothetical protein